jgi:hypothetical protein
MQLRSGVKRSAYMSEPGNNSADKIVLPAASARQAQTGIGVRYVLAISTFAAIAAMGLI